jgi:hypothetical protein
MKLISVCLCKPNGSDDIFGLRGLVATDEQEQEVIAALRVVHAIAWTNINLELRDAVAQISVRARIPMDEPIDSHQDASSAGVILEVVDPVPVLVCLLNAHARSVAYTLRADQSG